MWPILKSSAFALVAVTTMLVGLPERGPAQSYPIDCAILLCLAGGWPASEPCTLARVEFIRRITPWPVEPPLQIWRCPMGVSTVDPDLLTAERIYQVLQNSDARPQQSVRAAAPGRDPPREPKPDPALVLTPDPSGRSRPKGVAPMQVQGVTRGADVDISSPAFDFVRSIHVYHVTLAAQHEDDDPDGGGCSRSFSMRIGTYGPQGEFGWHPSDDPGQLPAAHAGLNLYGMHCPSVVHRSVFVDWHAYDGSYGFEQVTY